MTNSTRLDLAGQDQRTAWHLVAVLLAPAWLVSCWVVWKAKWFWSNNPDLQFGYIVVLLCAFLIHEAWVHRPPVRTRWGPVSLLAMVLGFAVLFLTQLYQTAYGLTPASMSGLGIGYVLVVLATLHFAFGWRGISRFSFGFLFLLIALPIPSVIYAPLVGGLQSLVARFNVELLNLIGIPAQQVGSLIHLPNGTVGIDEACSGVRSLQSTIMAAIFIGYVALKRNSLRLVLFGAGVVLAIVGNIGRSLYLSLMAHWRGMDAIEKVHDAAGWSVLAFTAAGVILLSWMISRAERAVQTAATTQAQADDD